MRTFVRAIVTLVEWKRITGMNGGWGADVARPRVAKRLDRPEEEMPSASTIERYWAKFEGRLYRRHRKRHPHLGWPGSRRAKFQKSGPPSASERRRTGLDESEVAL
jgi:hypothetical protein